NAAMDAALLGEKYSNKVHIININSEFRGEEEMKKRISQSQKITVYNDSKTTQINGDKFVSGVKFEKDGQTKEIPVQGVFIEIGSIPSVDFDKITEKNDYNEIKIHDEGYLSNVTSVKGVFAAGDVSDVPEKQIIVAGGEGVKAVLGIFKYLQKRA
ncbi:MAG: NAD(P)/FAD-dependent oxidoreductase, partial [Candidatus Micrarchaeia archaeon]